MSAVCHLTCSISIANDNLVSCIYRCRLQTASSVGLRLQLFQLVLHIAVPLLQLALPRGLPLHVVRQWRKPLRNGTSLLWGENKIRAFKYELQLLDWGNSACERNILELTPSLPGPLGTQRSRSPDATAIFDRSGRWSAWRDPAREPGSRRSEPAK